MYMTGRARTRSLVLGSSVTSVKAYKLGSEMECALGDEGEKLLS